MGKCIRFFMAVGFVLGIYVSGWGQVYEAWVARYNGPSDGDDFISALAVDDSGYVYVTGISPDSGSSNDYATIKYAPNGDTLWVRRYNGPLNSADYAYALTVDNNGNVYVTGTPATIKYKPNGDTSWVRCCGGYAVALDESGNVYVTGSTATIKYKANGDTSWVRCCGGYVVALDKSGNVYVTGASWNGSSYDYATIKYAPNGDTIWVKTYDGPGNGSDLPAGMVLDDSGNIIITGNSQRDSSWYGNRDFATIKYMPNGDTLWVRRFNGLKNSDNFPSDLKVDKSGTAFVTGLSRDSLGLWSFVIIKYAKNGDTVWVRQKSLSVNYCCEEDGPLLEVDAYGSCYVTVRGPLWETLTRKYSTSGDVIWTIRYYAFYSQPAGIVSTATGELYVSTNVYFDGVSQGGDYVTVKYMQCLTSPGDGNADGSLTLGDIISTVNYIFQKPGCLPLPLCWLSGLVCRGDWSGNGAVTLADVIQGVNFLFDKPGGPWNPIPSGPCCLPVP